MPGQLSGIPIELIKEIVVPIILFCIPLIKHRLDSSHPSMLLMY